MAGQDSQGAVDLLGQYDAGELMRQRDAAKGKEKIGALACGREPPVGGIDGEYEALDTLITDAADVSGELLRGVLLAIFPCRVRMKIRAFRLPQHIRPE